MRATSVDTILKHIQRISKALSILCLVGKCIVLALLIGKLITIAGLYFHWDMADKIADLYEHNTFYVMLSRAADLQKMEHVYRSSISIGVALITDGTLLFFLHIFTGFMKHLASGEQPFTVKNAKRMRHTSWLSILLCFYNFPMGLVMFGALLLFSYLMEYGAYLQEKADATNRIQEEMIVSFAEITENKSGQTGQHVKRVSEYARVLAEAMHRENSETIRIASTMHDIGKLLIPAEILEKPGKLTKEEYETIKLHTTYGGELLEHVEGDEISLARTIALEHHERWDGNGYPQKLNGPDISPEARIVAVADVYDALTSKRSYKEAWDEDDAKQEILRCSGTQFDPEVIDAFEASYDEILRIRQNFQDGQ